MKQLMILLGTILLGIVIFQMMAGNQPGSLKQTARDVMLHSISRYAVQGEGVL